MNNIREFLLRGKENATPADKLAVMLNVTRRDIERMVNASRREADQETVLSCARGYYLPSADPLKAEAEYNENISVLSAHIKQISSTKKNIQQAKKTLAERL